MNNIMYLYAGKIELKIDILTLVLTSFKECRPCRSAA